MLVFPGVPGPDRLLIELDLLALGAAEDHAAQAAITDRQCLDPAHRRLPVPEGEGTVCHRRGLDALDGGLVVVLGPALDVEPVMDRFEDVEDLLQQRLVERLLGPSGPLRGSGPGWPSR